MIRPFKYDHVIGFVALLLLEILLATKFLILLTDALNNL